MKLDPGDGALWALIAMALVLLGALLTPGTVGVNERGVVLTAIAATLFAIAWRGRRKEKDE